MAASKTYTCDVCGKRQKGETNHWLLSFLDDAGTGIRFETWEACCSHKDSPNAFHLCGQGCAVKHLEKCLTEVK